MRYSHILGYMNKREMQRECSRLRIEVARLESTLGERNQRIGRLRERVQVAERGYTGAIEEQGRLLGLLQAAEARTAEVEQAAAALIAERNELLTSTRQLEQELERERQVVAGMEKLVPKVAIPEHLMQQDSAFGPVPDQMHVAIRNLADRAEAAAAEETTKIQKLLSEGRVRLDPDPITEVARELNRRLEGQVRKINDAGYRAKITYMPPEVSYGDDDASAKVVAIVEPEAIRYALGESGADLPGASEA